MATHQNPYHHVFRAALATLPQGDFLWLDALLALPELPAVAIATKRSHLKKLIELDPQLLEKVRGLYPKADTIIDIVERTTGRVIETTLDASNRAAAAIVQNIAGPVVNQFVDTALRAYIIGDRITLTKSELMDFLLTEYSEFSKGAGNGLVSIAGTLNERILMRAMSNQGMIEGDNFQRTGTNSEADLIVHTRTGTRSSLGVELKSYHARERLLRGLQDIVGLKVGFGFFKDPSEFNAGRTQTLLQTHAAAIYMPNATLVRVATDSLAMTSNENIAFQSRFYRPIEQFVTDMLHYVGHGELPRY